MWFHRRRIGGILANVNGFPRVSKKISLKVWPTRTGSGVSTSSTSFKEDFVESMANVWKKISSKVWPKAAIVRDRGFCMANLDGVGSFHEFQRRFRWKYGQRFQEDFVESMANLNGVGSFHEFQRRFRWKYGQRLKEDFVESMAKSRDRSRSRLLYGQLGRGREFPRVSKKISLKVWPTFPRRFRWKYGQLERGREFPRVSKKISLKVWPTFPRRFRWKYGQLERGREFPRVSKKISLKVWPTFPRRFRWKYGQLERGREFPRVPRVSKKISLKVWPTTVNDHQPLFESKERQRSSEIKEDGLRFVLRVSEELYLNIYWILNIIWIGI